jgi:hypothetical protein
MLLSLLNIHYLNDGHHRHSLHFKFDINYKTCECIYDVCNWRYNWQSQGISPKIISVKQTPVKNTLQRRNNLH